MNKTPAKIKVFTSYIVEYFHNTATIAVFAVVTNTYHAIAAKERYNEYTIIIFLSVTKGISVLHFGHFAIDYTQRGGYTDGLTLIFPFPLFKIAEYHIPLSL